MWGEGEVMSTTTGARSRRRTGVIELWAGARPSSRLRTMAAAAGRGPGQGGRTRGMSGDNRAWDEGYGKVAERFCTAR